VKLREQFRVGWRLLRPFTLTASLVPVLTGTVLAATLTDRIHYGLAGAFLVAAMLIQAATNMFNEYFDYRRGLDTHEMVGIAGAIVRDGVSPHTVLGLAWGFSGTAILIGLYISALSSWWVFAGGLFCIAIAYLYSGGPVPLAYTAFGEIAAGTMMGPVIVMLSYYVQAERLTPLAVTLSLPVGLLIGAILLSNNIRDMEQDKLGGRRTLAIRLGRHGGRYLLGSIFALSYAIVVGLVLARLLTPWTLLVLASAPRAVWIIRRFARHTVPMELHPAVKGTAQLLMIFGVLLLAGMVIGG